jgi:hypothetical protein
MIAPPLTSPTPAQLARAIDDGAAVACGLPTYVELDDGPASDTWAVPNLVEARAGAPDPWTVVRHLSPSLTEIGTECERLVAHDAAAATVADLAWIDAALRAAPPPHGRHSRAADRARLDAGRAAMRISNAMLRSRILDLVDGWPALAESGRVIDDDPLHGRLVAVPDTPDARILLVTCPSTGRRYALGVPADCATARDARTWTLHGTAPEVET